MELQTTHRYNKICTERKKICCTLMRTNCWKAYEKNLNIKCFDLDDADELWLTLILKTVHFVPVTEQSFFE